ncbi:probable LRR receptor-like serine/threonine-protein kinase RFK1 isoform X1 [Papaver somniferum]|uniref:probable LRR receptor-like serine/threonine-protein kinase RFK1 isoform X1 n=1 Tax=Papaver somniferum TaxID=3469 RepID=UPI000E6F5802|nr:probable LRR receptor-like serine/threonine-protein kinase RFK1 isoform X1 [Papaver somniferum]
MIKLSMRPETHEPYETATFSFRYIEVATRNFSPANKIGQGSSGSVYKGMVPNGRTIAVKQLSLESDQGKVEFLNEVNTVSTLRHPNIIRLLGHCAENDQHLLVYEYMENGCLNKALFGPVNLKNKLSWPAKLRIFIGIAKGLAYLHSDNSKMKIVHRDIKLSNILLDKDLNPRISDFGLIMHYNREISHIKTGLAGTVGYMAPEYVMQGTVSEKIDVYSFGIVTLELMTGKNRIQWKTKHESISLLDLACDLQKKGDLVGIFDQDMRMNIPVKEAEKVLNLAILCTNYDPKLRPTMSEVVDIMAIVCSNSNCTTRIDSTANIADISFHNLSSTTMHHGNAVSSNDVLDYSDGASAGSSSNGVPAMDEISKDIELHLDFSGVPLSQVTVASAELLGLDVEPQTSSISKDTYRKRGVESKLELFKPFFEEGKLHIEFSDEEFRAVCDEWENSLVGFFVDEDVPFSMDLKMVEKLWEVKGDFCVFTIENGYFIFQFSCAEEKMRILESANLRKIRQRQLILKEWDWKLMVERIGMESLPIWVKIYNLPLFFWTPPVLSKVGSGLGTPLYADRKTQNKEQLAYAMLCIEFDADKPLPESLRILVKGMEYHLNLEYDWRPLRCENCCTFGHIALNCKLKMKAKKQN